MVRPVEDKNPVVIGRLGTGQGRPTITFYGHYDVQVGAKGQSWGGCLKVKGRPTITFYGHYDVQV